jgi:histidine triad (HIT) family protein
MANGQMTPEQQKELQEKLKNMSPEELKEFQKKQCIFCQIISGKVASKKVYEDEKCLAILDINPANPGHLLVMLKEHYQIMPMVPDDEIAHLGIVSKALSQALLKSLKVEGTNIFIANGAVAGQRAQHFMLHVIPRKEGDGVGMEIPEKQIDQATLAAIKKAVRDRIVDIFKIKKETVEAEKKLKEKPKVEAEFEEKEEVKEEKPEEIQEEKKQASPAASKEEAKSAGKEEMPEKLTEEPLEETEKETPKKKPSKKKLKKKEKPEEESEVNLDDIAGLFG